MVARLILICVVSMLASGMAAAQSCPKPAESATQISHVIAATNSERRQRGLPALRVSASLMRAAQGHACAMVNGAGFSHRGHDGSTPKVRVRRAGCSSRLTAENIAMGYSGGAQTMQLWRASGGHMRNILLRGVTSIGVGVAAPRPGQGGGPRWVQVFANGC